MSDNVRSAVESILGKPDLKLSIFEKRVLQSILKKNTISRDTEREFDDTRRLGEKLSDQIARIGGSWTFVIVFLSVLVGWIALNSLIVSKAGETFDPYPYILLNLLLSITAAIQGPVIMMSQNRQAEKDRLQATNDYEVNLKAELEVQRLHEKLDATHKGEWTDLIKTQERQIHLLQSLLGERNLNVPPKRQ